MNQFDEVQKAFKLLIDSRELGHSDTMRLNELLGLLDMQGEVSKEKAIEKIVPDSKDPDGNYRNFISRVKAAIEAAAKAANTSTQEIYKSMKIENFKGVLRLRASIPKQLHTTVKENMDYRAEEYVSTSGTKRDTIKYFVSYASADATEANLFKSKLEEITKADSSFSQWSMVDLQIGEDFDQRIKEELRSCNYGICLLSKAFFDSDYIMETEADFLLRSHKAIPVGLKGEMKEILDKKRYSQNAKNLLDLEIHMFKDRGGEEFFSVCTTDSCREQFVKEFYEKLKRRIEEDRRNPPARSEESIADISRKNEYLSKEHIPQYAHKRAIENKMESLTRSEAKETAETNINKINIQKDLKQWVEEEGKPLYAVLGDFGMGKTFNCRIFARNLKHVHAQDTTKPAVVYIDLRDIPTYIRKNDETRQPYLPEIIEEVLRQSNNTRYSAQEIIEGNRRGEIVLIFDGLDEKLVHYSKEMQGRFLDELLSSVEIQSTANTSKQKILISCRSHYFASVTQENNYLRAYGRRGIPASAYSSIDIIPLEMKAIKELIHKKLPHTEAQRLIEIIQSEAHLKELASKPLIAGKLTSMVQTLSRLREQGSQLTTKMFYAALIEDALLRDDEKHTISIAHKKELLSALAMQMHQTHEQNMEIDTLNDWFVYFVDTNPKFRHYMRKEEIEMLERDLRNSTLLVRFGEESFGFSHSSIYEYFLSQYLVTHWEEVEEDARFSELTGLFVLESIPELKSGDADRLFAQITETLRQPSGAHTAMALEILSVLRRPIERVRLEGAELEGFRFAQLNIDRLEIIDSDLYRAGFAESRIGELQITNSNLNESTFVQTHCENIRAEGSHMARITAIDSALGWERVPPQYHLLPAVHLLPFPERIERGHSSPVTSVAFSPDGSEILSGAWDNTLKLWSREGQCLQTFEGHSSPVTSVAFSPDGSEILSGAWDNTLKLWSREGQCLQTFEGHSGFVTSVAFSPDGSEILSGARDGTLKLWSREGQCLQTFEGHSDSVTSVAFSPDGSEILSGADDGVTRWGREAGKLQSYFAKGATWYSIDYLLGRARGTALAWRHLTLSHAGEHYTLDQMAGFALEG